MRVKQDIFSAWGYDPEIDHKVAVLFTLLTNY